MTLKQIDSTDINAMEQRFRAHFINSLSGFKSANLVGTVDANGVSNLAIVSSVFHLGATPPLVGLIIRPDTVPRGTLANIQSTECYTLNHVNSAIWQQAHQSSARYATGVSEFKQTGLSETYVEGICAPFVEQSHLRYALKLREVQPLAINGTILVIGEVIHIQLPHTAIQQDGYIDIESLDTITISGLDSYHRTQSMGRLTYAKPDKLPQLLQTDSD